MTSEERDKLRDYLDQRDKVTWWIVPPENLAKIAEIMCRVQEDTAGMSEEEINALIDEALTEVQRERCKRRGGV
jgi:hypothetical protein